MASSRWYYAKADQVFGPMDASELKRLAASGEFGPNDRVRKEEMQQWVQAGAVKNLFAGSPPQGTSTKSAVGNAGPPNQTIAPAAEAATGKIPIFGDESHVPESIGGIPFSGVTIYPNPHLGVSIAYGLPQTVTVTTYLYDGGESGIPEDLQSQEVVQRFEEAIHSVSAAAEKGLYVDFEVLKAEYLHVPSYSADPDWLWAAFSYRENPDLKPDAKTGKQIAFLALRTDEGYVNKVRFTADYGRESDAYVTFLRFLVSWRDAIAARQAERLR